MVGTYMIYVTSRVEWCYRQDLELTGDISSLAKAARRSSGAVYERRRAPNASSELGTSFTRSPRS